MIAFLREMWVLCVQYPQGNDRPFMLKQQSLLKILILTSTPNTQQKKRMTHGLPVNVCQEKILCCCGPCQCLFEEIGLVMFTLTFCSFMSLFCFAFLFSHCPACSCTVAVMRVGVVNWVHEGSTTVPVIPLECAAS